MSYSTMEESKGIFAVVEWNATQVGFYYKENGLELKYDNGWTLNGAYVSNPVARTVYETQLYSDFVQDKNRVDELEKEIQDIKQKYEEE